MQGPLRKKSPSALGGLQNSSLPSLLRELQRLPQRDVELALPRFAAEWGAPRARSNPLPRAWGAATSPGRLSRMHHLVPVAA